MPTDNIIEIFSYFHCNKSQVFITQPHNGLSKGQDEEIKKIV